MKVALVGFEVEGRAAYSYWAKLGAEITICDQDTNKQLPDGAQSQLGENYLTDLDRFDVVWRTAGINPLTILATNPGVADKLTTTMNEFLRACPTKHVIGVTGTKGKGTTSTLISKMLTAAGHTVFLGGNIGLSPFEFLEKVKPDSWVILELSSFQLLDLKRSPHIAVCLMVVPEHLNWHADLDDYIAAKSQLFAHQTSEDIAIYYAKSDTSQEIANHSAGTKIPYFSEPGAIVKDGFITIGDHKICQTDEIKLLGSHNWQNVCAALTAVWQVTQDVTAARSVLTTFSGLEHRLEFVREVDNVKYYNDSYASGPDSAAVALDAIPGKKVIILGGFDRNLPLSPLVESISEHADTIQKVVIIGASGPRLAQELDKVNYKNYVIEPSKQIEEVVAKARTQAVAGDSVILTPGFASFDMFKNFTVRGLEYKAAVEKL